jgi:hypothetical protein
MPNSDVTLESSPLDNLKGQHDGDKLNNVYANQVDKQDNVYENSIDKQKNVYENSANIQAELALSKGKYVTLFKKCIDCFIRTVFHIRNGCRSVSTL